MSVNCLQYNYILILYAKYIAKMLCMVRLWNEKCFETGPKRCCSGRNSTSTCSGSISAIKQFNWQWCCGCWWWCGCYDVNSCVSVSYWAATVRWTSMLAMTSSSMISAQWIPRCLLPTAFLSYWSTSCRQSAAMSTFSMVQMSQCFITLFHFVDFVLAYLSCG